MKNQPKIAIIGAGPGGLVLARILHLHGIEAAVFEREECPTVRPQGGSLDMHVESGQYAIQCAGLSEEFKRIARYDDQESRVYDKHGTLRFLEEDLRGKDRPEVDRGHLRQMLLNSLPTGVIRWDHELSSIEPQDDGTYELVFRKGASEMCGEKFDLVVGADGAWSRVRPLLSDARPAYSGVMFIELGIDDVDVKYPDVARIVGRGLMFALGDCKAIIGHRDANAHIGTYAALRVPEDWFETGGLDRSSSDATKSSLASHFSDWSEDLLQLIYLSGDRISPRPIHALPIGHRWEHRPGVTLIGDAAHLMSPFGGDGANLAMLDAADLALALTADGDWRAAVQRFEVTMLARAEEAAAGAKEGIEGAFSEDALAHTLEVFEGHRRDHSVEADSR
jgi:2-polyprenyl-6-methoxyphenol hydroxylase-like FAD-dependent oxidoreductase